ncbi:peptidyl-prolyl cis-trans isomerase NIMA-interacting 4 [Spatholobus suberectus]|nr:peptidyl-prolyl cis-trans isomerase NIMA-interacting 4 [Spatholobus suberectus]
MSSSFHGSCLKMASLFGFLFHSARHVSCEKQGKINAAYKKLQDGWLSNGDKVPPVEFVKVFFFWRSHNDFILVSFFKSLFGFLFIMVFCLYDMIGYIVPCPCNYWASSWPITYL